MGARKHSWKKKMTQNQTSTDPKWWEELQKQLEEAKKAAETKPVCPQCGYCPHCGRGGQHYQPFCPPSYPQITWTSGYIQPVGAISGAPVVTTTVSANDHEDDGA